MTALSLQSAAREAPDRPALITPEGTLTFTQLAEQVGKVAAHWAEGFAGELVAILARHDRETVIGIHALMTLGIPFLPLSPKLSPEEKARTLQFFKPSAVIDRDQLSEAIKARVPGNHAAPPDDERPLTVVQTSGSTGQPKGVVLSRRAFCAGAQGSAHNLPWRSEDRWLASLPFSHVGGLSVLTRCLAGRRPAVLVSPGASEAIHWGIHQGGATLGSVVPTQLHKLLREAKTREPPPNLRGLLVGGARAPEALLEEARALGWPLLTTYGLTETCSQVATQAEASRWRGEPGVGRPLRGTEVRLSEGVIEVRGPTLFSGYFGDPNPSLDTEGWFRTGDLGELDPEGRLYVLGRKSDLIISGGENLYPAEIEPLLESCPGVRGAVVFGIPDPTWGEVVAAAVEGEIALDSLAQWVSGKLAPWKRPRWAAVVSGLPRLSSGKLDRIRSRELGRSQLQPWPPSEPAPGRSRA